MMKYDNSKFGLSLLGYLQLSISPRGLGHTSCGRCAPRINLNKLGSIPSYEQV
nr:MAG TPA: NADH-ubiquinone oxidoreductase [Caudoviricetes sp.]